MGGPGLVTSESKSDEKNDSPSWRIETQIERLSRDSELVSFSNIDRQTQPNFWTCHFFFQCGSLFYATTTLDSPQPSNGCKKSKSLSPPNTLLICSIGNTACTYQHHLHLHHQHETPHKRPCANLTASPKGREAMSDAAGVVHPPQLQEGVFLFCFLLLLT